MKNEQTLFEGIGTMLLGAAAYVIGKSSPAMGAATLVTAATYDQIVRRSESARRKLKIVAKNTNERRANIKHVNELIRKYGYRLDMTTYLPNDGMEWELSR